MKRPAESQLTKDSRESDDEAPQEEGSGFQKADPSVLGERRIRGLPRRSLVTTNGSTSASPVPAADASSGTTEQPPESSSRFGSFAGFGRTGGATHAFTFNVPSSQTNQKYSQSTATPFSSTSTTSSASPAYKSFSSFTNPSNITPPRNPPLTSDAQKKQDVALKYYMSLRGINSSFLDAATKAMQRDPFVDIVDLLEEYRLIRHSIQREFDSHSEISGTVQTAKKFVPSVNPLGSPSKFLTDWGTTSASTAGVSTPNVDHSSGSGSSPFSRSEPYRPSTTNDKPAVEGSSFSFGKSTPGSTQSSVEGPTKPIDSRAAASPPTTAGNDQTSSKAEASSFSLTSTSATPLTPGLSSFLGPSKPLTITGEASAHLATKFEAPSNSSPSSSTFGFGSSKNFSSSSSFGSFGKGSIGNPVGFGFGSPSSTPIATKTSDPVSRVTASTKSEMETQNPPVEASTSNVSDAEHDPSPAPSHGSAYDADGPGEEEESTLYETRAQAFKPLLTGEKKGLVSVGSGQLKLKVHNELSRRRILMRSSSTGQIILNFNLFLGFQVKVDKRVISFRVPGEDETATVYRLRVPTEADALKWQETIHTEVDRLVPSSDT